MSAHSKLPSDELLEHRAFLERFARRLARDTSAAEDLVQETLLAALQRPPPDRRNLRAWLRRVARNVFLRRQRTPSPAATLEDVPVESSESLDESLDRQALSRVLAAELLSLGEPYRRVLLLRYYEGKSPSAIARELGRPLNTVTSQMGRGLKLLHERLDRSRPGGRSRWMSVLAWFAPSGRPGARRARLRGGHAASAAGSRNVKAWLAAAAAVIALPVLVPRGSSLPSETVPHGAELAQQPAAADGAQPFAPRETPAPGSTRASDAAPETANVPPPSEARPTDAPAHVLLSGAAVRVDPLGAEHPGEDGQLTLAADENEREEFLQVPVHGGQFAVDVPPRATLYVKELVLAGRFVRPPPVWFGVPENRFVLLRADELRPVLLHVTAEDGRELADVEIHSAADDPLTNLGRKHPGSSPERSACVSAVPSPVSVAPQGASVYWVRARGYAWAPVALDHVAGGERSLTLQPACTLEVQLVGLESWLQASVRLWKTSQLPTETAAFAEREPDGAGAHFEALAPGDYVISAERSNDGFSFGQASISIAAGEDAFVAVPLTLPERPHEVTVSGTLALHSDWPSEDVRLTLAPANGSSTWPEEPVSVPLAETSAVRAADAAFRVFAWKTVLPAAGDYELAVFPPALRQRLTIPPRGASDVEVLVPAAAEVEVRVVDEETGAELEAKGLYWSPLSPAAPIEPEFFVLRDPARNCVSFRTMTGALLLATGDPSLRISGETVSVSVHPGLNRIQLRAERRIGVRIRLSDRGRILPWSEAWALSATRLDGEARDVARSIGALWFDELGSYRLSAPAGIPGYASVDGTPFEVRPLAPGEKYLELEIPLRRSER